MAFQENYGTDAQREAVLEAMRWPNGFARPECGCTTMHRLQSRGLHRCADCHRQTSLTAGTIFEHTKLPLTIWFRGMCHLTQSKNGVSAMELMRRLGVSYNTACMLKQKLKQVMLEREAGTMLTERVEIDDAYIGGERSGGKVGRGAEGKASFLPLYRQMSVADHGEWRCISLAALPMSRSTLSRKRNSSLQPTFTLLDWPASQLS